LFLGAGEEINDLEINPLMVLPAGRGVCAVDVRWS
jgi:succinyl-CoA synthetase beta subunit